MLSSPQHARMPRAASARRGRQGIQPALPSSIALHARDPAFVPSETEINLWGYALMEESAGLDDVIAMFKFGTQLYPGSANLSGSLGEAQQNTDDIAAAIASYRRSLELNPKNTKATAHLAVLTSGQLSTARGL